MPIIVRSWRRHTLWAQKAKAHRAAVDLVNANGGSLGRKIELIADESQTNPEAAIRAARKMTDADQATAIIGTWASSETIGIMPLCQNTNVIQLFRAWSDNLPDGDHKHLCLIPQASQQGLVHRIGWPRRQAGLSEGPLRGLQDQFAASMGASFGKAPEVVGGQIIGEPLFYNPNQLSFRMRPPTRYVSIGISPTGR